MLKNSVYLFLGNDWAAKQRKISEIKQKKTNTSLPGFNSYLFYGDELSSETLKDSLYTLSTDNTQRLVVIKAIERLSQANKEIILSFIKKPNPDCIIILDSQALDLKDNSFLQEISSLTEIINFRKFEKKENVFNLCREIERKNSATALSMLSELLTAGEKPLKILGAISWYWASKKAIIDRDRLKNGFTLLLQTDNSIKSGKMSPDFALEFLVIRLSA